MKNSTEAFSKQGFSERLKTARSDLWSQAEFAEMLGYSRRQYGKFESETEPNTPDLPAFYDMVSLLSTSPGWLLQGIGPRYIDIKTARRLQVTMDRLLDIDSPNFSQAVKSLLTVDEKTLLLVIDFLDLLKTHQSDK